MITDNVDNLLIQWEEERPDLSAASLGIIVRISHLAKILGERASRALDPASLSLWEYDVLSALRRQGPPFELSASQLAEQSLLSTGAMTNRIDRLENRQLVRRISCTIDRRRIQIQLTEKARQLMSYALELRLEAADKSLNLLSAKEQELLNKLLRKLLSLEDTSTSSESPSPSRQA